MWRVGQTVFVTVVIEPGDPYWRDEVRSFAYLSDERERIIDIPLGPAWESKFASHVALADQVGEFLGAGREMILTPTLPSAKELAGIVKKEPKKKSRRKRR
jgi:hypothetical protein